MRYVGARRCQQGEFALVQMHGMHADKAGAQQAPFVQSGQRAFAMLFQAVFDFLSCFMDMAVDRQVQLFR